MCKKTASLLLALIMTLSCVSALAENTKHEHVFAVLNPEGAVQTLTDSVRLENADALSTLTDRTLLTGIENAGGHEAFTLEGESLTWEAAGKDITYQGTSDKALPVAPVVTLRLDGKDVTAQELSSQSGRAEITVSYTQAEQVPHLAISALMLPESGVSGLTLENASMISVAGRQAVVGWAVPGADEASKLPTSFSFSFDADHAKLDWMMTLASADPIDAACKELASRLDLDAGKELSDAVSLLTALKDGEPLPLTAGKTKDLSAKLLELNGGLQLLNDGAKRISDGAAALDDGLATLSGNSESLNGGADAIFTAILSTANQQIAASGLTEAGITLPELTAENYQESLKIAVAQLQLASAVSEEAKAGYESLSALLEQLTQVDTFVQGVHAYTGGVDKAAAGAKELSSGAATLHDTGTDTLRTSILTAEKQAAEKLLPLLQDKLSPALRIYEETAQQVQSSGYDLRPEGMKTVTLYILRTDL